MKERVLCACSGSLLVWGVAQKGDVHTTDKQDSGSQNRFVEARLLKANSNGEDLNLVGLTGVKLSQRHSTSDRFMMMTSDEGGECNTVSHFKVLKIYLRVRRAPSRLSSIFLQVLPGRLRARVVLGTILSESVVCAVHFSLIFSLTKFVSIPRANNI